MKFTDEQKLQIQEAIEDNFYAYRSGKLSWYERGEYVFPQKEDFDAFWKQVES